MDKNTEYNYFNNPMSGTPLNNSYFGVPNNNANSFSSFNPYDFGQDSNSTNSIDSNTLFNPLMQYEQAYMYYRYLAMQMEYKIKCREYEKLSSNSINNSKSEFSRDSNRKIE